MKSTTATHSHVVSAVTLPSTALLRRRRPLPTPLLLRASPTLRLRSRQVPPLQQEARAEALGEEVAATVARAAATTTLTAPFL